MSRVIILGEYPKVLKPGESLISALADSAKTEMEKGINNKTLIEIYKRTYGRYIAGKVFRMICF